MSTKHKILFVVAMYLLVGAMLSIAVAETQSIFFLSVGVCWFALNVYWLKQIKCPKCGTSVISKNGLILTRQNSHCKACNADLTKI